jgi:membrane protein DedA with SNARE-associated domain
MHYFDSIINYLMALSTRLPLEIFVLIGSFFEEVIAPIPSPLVMTMSGSIAGIQQRALPFLIVLALIGAIGKIAGTVIFYYLASIMGDLFLDKLGRFIGVSNKDVEKIGKNFSRGTKDFWVILLARVIPIMPTSPVTVVCGILRLEPKSFFTASFLGYFGRGLIYLLLGFFAYGSYESIVQGFESVESIVQIILVLILGLGIAYFYYKRSKGEGESILSKIVNRKQN